MRSMSGFKKCVKKPDREDGKCYPTWIFKSPIGDRKSRPDLADFLSATKCDCWPDLANILLAIWPPFGLALGCPLAPLAWELANVNICKPKRNPSPPEFWHPNEESVAHLAAC